MGEGEFVIAGGQRKSGIYDMVNIFMDDLLGEEEYIRGKSEVKTLRLSGEKRQQLLENLQTVEVVNTNSAYEEGED